MKLVERHVITKNHPFWSEIDHKAFLSKNLLNLANYYYRQYFFKYQKKLNFTELYHQVSKSSDYQAIPSKVSKQIMFEIRSKLDKLFCGFKRMEKTAK